MTTIQQTANAYFSTLSSGDIDGFAALLADDIVWHQPGSNRFSGTHRGKTAVLEMLGGMVAHTQGTLKVAADGKIMFNGNFAACPVRFSGNSGSRQVDLRGGVDVLEIQNGKINQVWLFSAGDGEEDAFWG